MQVSFYLLLVLHVTEGCTLQNQGQTKEVNAYKRGSVLLPCYCTDVHATPETFTWRKHTSRGTWEEISSESDQYRDKVQLFNNHSPANLSLLISHLTEEDRGVYQCYLKENIYVYIRLDLQAAPITTTTPGVKRTTRPVTSTKPSTRISSQNEAFSTASPQVGNSSLIIFAAVGVLLLLVVLGGVICWRFRAQRRAQIESCERKAGLRRDQETQDCSESLHHTATSEPTDEEAQKQNNSEVLYATINPQSKSKKVQEKDNVTYSTVVHIKASTPASTVMDTEDSTEYACIKLN